MVVLPDPSVTTQVSSSSSPPPTPSPPVNNLDGLFSLPPEQLRQFLVAAAAQPLQDDHRTTAPHAQDCPPLSSSALLNSRWSPLQLPGSPFFTSLYYDGLHHLLALTCLFLLLACFHRVGTEAAILSVLFSSFAFVIKHGWACSSNPPFYFSRQ